MTSHSLGELGERIWTLAQVPNLLVACDYDGTIAPLVDNPALATPNRASTTAIKALAEQADTHVTVISGRSLRDLTSLSRLPEEIRLVGSHGSEFDLSSSSKLPAATLSLRNELVNQLRQLGKKYGALVEEKPAGGTFHFRSLSPEAAESARDEVVQGPAAIAGIHTRNGHDVIELSVIETNKGNALDQLRSAVGATAVIFIGDNVTDEDGFRTLSGPDVGIHVGEGPTAADFRIPDPDTVAQVLALLCELRSEWLRGSGLVPISDHSLLSDLRTAAIVSPQARITWLCVPRIDSSAVFAELLGGPSAGHFSVMPEDNSPAKAQNYRANSMVLETSFANFTVTDYLDASAGRTKRLAGRSDLIRIIEGSGKLKIEFAPRLDFGRAPTLLEICDNGINVQGTVDLMVLRSPNVDWEVVAEGIHHTALGTVNLNEGPVTLELRSGTGTLRSAAKDEIERQADTIRFWNNWANRLDLPDIEREQVSRSALILKSLCHGPTGAIISAATTSLPEHLGGVRNWDYRYCWLRDGALTAATLARINSHAEGMAFLNWVSGILETRTDPERLAPLYHVTGRHLAPEAEIAELQGYGGSRPIRVGNAADSQVQLDVFGPIVDLVHILLRRGESLSTEHWRLVENMVLAVARRWQEPDHGIWEIRRPPRQHVYSKVMCWVTVDRAIAIADHFLDREPAAWVKLRDQIADDVLTKGWKPNLGTFTAAFYGDDLDCSVLAIGLSGLLKPNDERFVATVAAVERQLRSGPTVYRYAEDDGLPGREGGFNLMTSWMIDSMALVGRRDEAVALFADLISLVGPTGTMTEQYEPKSKRSLGNMPRAYSHLGLINNALTLEGA